MGNRLARYLGYDLARSSEEQTWLIEEHENRWVASTGHFAVIIVFWGLLAPIFSWAMEGKRSLFLKFQSSFVNPPQGLLATANNKIASNAYPHHLSTYWDPDWRIRRISELLGSGGPFGVEDMKTLQRDVNSVHARDVVPVILQAYDSVDVSDALVRDALTYFRNWAFEMHERDVATSIFHAFLMSAISNTFRDELGAQSFALFDSLATPSRWWR